MITSIMEVPSSHPLAGIRAKIERADESICRLDAEIIEHVKNTADRYSSFGGFESDGLNYLLKVRGSQNTPTRFAVIGGEVIHHLRSVYDHLVVALAAKHGQRALNTHQFPICRKAEKFEKSVGSGCLKGVPANAADAIRRLQPFLQADPTNYILNAIYELDNTDKHSLLLVVTAAAQIGQGIRVGGERPATIVALGDPRPALVSESGAEVFRITLAEPEPSFHAEMDFEVQIAFQKIGPAEAVPVTKALVAFRGFTVDTISSFLPCF
ncbi:MAG: hypothetical protein ACK4FG_03595 [Brevundimonas sp.]